MSDCSEQILENVNTGATTRVMDKIFGCDDDNCETQPKAVILAPDTLEMCEPEDACHDEPTTIHETPEKVEMSQSDIAGDSAENNKKKNVLSLKRESAGAYCAVEPDQVCQGENLGSAQNEIADATQHNSIQDGQELIRDELDTLDIDIPDSGFYSQNSEASDTDLSRQCRPVLVRQNAIIDESIVKLSTHCDTPTIQRLPDECMVTDANAPRRPTNKPAFSSKVEKFRKRLFSCHCADAHEFSQCPDEDDECDPPTAKKQTQVCKLNRELLEKVEKFMIDAMVSIPPYSPTEELSECFRSCGGADAYEEVRSKAPKKLESLTRRNTSLWFLSKNFTCGSSHNFEVSSTRSDAARLSMLPVQVGGARSTSNVSVFYQEMGECGETYVIDWMNSNLHGSFIQPGKILNQSFLFFSSTPDGLALNPSFNSAEEHFMDRQDSVMGIVECKTSLLKSRYTPQQLKSFTVQELIKNTRPPHNHQWFTNGSFRKEGRFPQTLVTDIVNRAKETTKWKLIIKGDDGEDYVQEYDMDDAKNGAFLKLFTSAVGRQVLSEAITVIPYVGGQDIKVYLPLPSVVSLNDEEDDKAAVQLSFEVRFMAMCEFSLPVKGLKQLNVYLINDMVKTFHDHAVQINLMERCGE